MLIIFGVYLAVLLALCLSQHPVRRGHLIGLAVIAILCTVPSGLQYLGSFQTYRSVDVDLPGGQAQHFIQCEFWFDSHHCLHVKTRQSEFIFHDYGAVTLTP
jgi:hypothetical protein